MQQADCLDHMTFCSLRLPLMQDKRTGIKSLSRILMYDWVSGSPKRALNSMTFGPPFVIIIPGNKIPLNVRPLFFKAIKVGITIFSLISFICASVIHDTGAIVPMPPVFFPLSPSRTLLWSCDGGNKKAYSPSQKACIEI